jgi:hypothetical protein
VHRLRSRADIAFFNAHPAFNVVRRTSPRGEKQVFLRVDSGLSITPMQGIRDWPPGWSAAKAAAPCLNDAAFHACGSLICAACGRSARHELRWPTEAWFQIDYRGRVLWAFHREGAVALLDFIRSADRRRSGLAQESFLRRIPGHFLTAKARAQIVRKLETVLAQVQA